MADITTSITGAEFRDEINRELMAYDESVMMQPIYYYNHNVKQILTFESTGDAGVTFTGGAYNTTYYKVGSSSRGFTNLAGTQIMTVSWASNINLATFNNGMVSATSDFINIVVYIDGTIPTNVFLEFSTNNNGSSIDINEFLYNFTSLSSGYNYLSIAKSSFAITGNPNWNSLGFLRLFYYGGDATTDIYYDCLHMQRKDPGANVANPFQRQINGIWTADFLLDGGYWFIGYENNELIMRDIKAGGGYRLAYSVKTFQDFNVFATMKVNSANQATGIAWYYNAGNVIRVGIDGNTLYIKTLENSIDSTISIPMATSPGDVITFYFIKNKSTTTAITYNARTGNKLSISKETTILYTNFGTVGIYHSLNNPTTVYNFGASKLLYVPNSGNSDTVGGKLASNTANNLAIYDNNGRVLDSDKVDGYNAGNSSGQVPISNGTICTNLVSNTTAIMTLDNTILLEKLSEQITDSINPITVATIIVKHPGNYRFTYDSRISNGSYSATVLLTINNIIYSQISEISTIYSTKSIDLYNFSAGTKIEVKLYSSNSIANAFIQNIRVRGILGIYPENSIV